MKVYILNSNVMPQDGIYRRTNLSTEEFKYILNKSDEIVSSISYKAVVDVIKEITGIDVPLDIDKSITRFKEPNAVILTCSLKFRPKSERKGKDQFGLDHYQFCLIEYTNDKHTKSNRN